MKIALTFLSALLAGGASASLFGFPCSCLCGDEGAGASTCGAEVEVEDTAIRGRYLEARTASVYAGACHYNGEFTTQGRDAVVGLAIESGVVEGVDLAGLGFVAAITAEENLDEEGERRTALYLPEGIDDAQEAALLTVVDTHLEGVVGTVERIRRAPFSFDREGDTFALGAGDGIELTGSLMADRACCSMPQNVWYEPLLEVEGAIVGLSETFRCADEDLGLRFARYEENNAFAGRFEFAPAMTVSATPKSSCCQAPTRASLGSEPSCCATEDVE